MSEPHLIGGRFEIHELIGQGGMGDVFRGVDTRSGETVAIKSLKPDITAENPQLIERFIREGDALRKLNHPSIVKMLAALDEDDRHYLVMEYVSGGTLADLLRDVGAHDRAPLLPIERILDIALDLADALTRAHRLKIIHRDIKPQNVMLAEDGTPRLTDFGVAHLQDRTRVTETGSMIGTYAYLSPEACSGEELDARSDIWALGVMLYEMLAGRRPFEANQPAVILTAILTKPVPDILQFRPDAPAKLVALIYAMLEKDRENRVASVRLVGAQLESMIHGSGTEKLFDATTPTPTRQDLDGPTVATPIPAFAQTPPVTEVAPKQPRPLPWRWLAVGGVLVVALAALMLPGALNRPADAVNDGNLNIGSSAVVPAAEGEYMVLVAQLEKLGSEERDVTRFIVDDLTAHLEDEVPLANLAIRAYPAVITSDGEALAAAEASGASVIIWGNYDDSRITLDVQVGSLAPFPANSFARDLLERTGNVRVQMTDARRESVAPQVLGLMNVLHTGNSDAFEIARNLVVMDGIDVTSAEIVGNSPAAHWHRYFASYLSDTVGAIEIMDTAIELDARNPIFYSARGLAHQRLGLFDAALRDADSAQQLGPEGWATPFELWANDALFFQDDFEAAADYYSPIVETLPDAWYPLSFRGIAYYQLGQYDLARADLERAALDAEANFPYPYLVALALREGRMADARSLFNTVLTRFPDPELADRLLEVVYGGTGANSFYGFALAAFGNTTLRQWDVVVEEVNDAVAEGFDVSDLLVFQGFAYCNLGDYAAAEAAYTQGIELEPAVPIGYVLRAEVRLKQLKLLDANADAALARQLAQEQNLGDELAAYVDGGLRGQVGCDNFFEWEPPA